MINKNLTEKLSYEELSEEMNELVNSLKESKKFHKIKTDFAVQLMNLREYVIKNYDKYNSEEKQDMMNKFELIDQYSNDYIRTNI